MSGVAIIGYLLANYAPLTAEVGASKIVSGHVKLNTTLPAISVMKISANQHNTLSMTAAEYLVSERVQITVMDYEYATVQSIMALARDAVPNTRATVNTFACQAILPNGEGADIYDPEIGVHFQTQDYIVMYNR